MLLSSRRRAESGDAVHFGHHDVQKHQLDLLRTDDIQGFPPGIGLEQLIVRLGGQIDFQRGDDVPVVVADEDVVHRSVSSVCCDFRGFVILFYKKGV